MDELRPHCSSGFQTLVEKQIAKNKINKKIFIIIITIIIITIIIKKGQQCKAGRSDIHPISPKTPAPQYQPNTNRKKRKGTRVEDHSRDRAA